MSTERDGLLEGQPVDDYQAVPRSPVVQDVAFTDAVQEAKPSNARMISLDLLRGVVMPLMAVDHAGIIFGNWAHGNEQWSARLKEWPPTNVFIMRLVTDPCAPAFTAVMGVGIVFFATSRAKLGWKAGRLMKHFVLRGLVIVLANQITALQWLITRPGSPLFASFPLFHLGFNFPIFGAIFIGATTAEKKLSKRLARSDRASWAAGIVDGGLVALSAALLAITLALVPPEGTRNEDRPWLFWFLFLPAPMNPVGRTLLVYSPFGWLSLGVFGLFLGRWLGRRKRTRAGLNAWSVAGALVLFAVWVPSRLLNFGTLAPRMVPPQDDGGRFNWKNFIYASKYPPDLSYSTLWTGVCFLLFAACEAFPPTWAGRTPFLDIGRAPLFFFIVHFEIFGIMRSIVPVFGLPETTGPGAQFWVEWAIGCGLTWLLCRAFARFKATTSSDSFWRLF